MENPIVSVVIGSYQRNGFIQIAIESIRSELINIAHEIIVIDGGSTDGSLQWLLKQKDIITVIQHNRGTWNTKPIIKRSWGYFMNLGFKMAKGKYICMLSDDCIVTPNSIQNGILLFEEKTEKMKQKIGAIAFYWRNWPKQHDYWVGKTWGDRIFVNHGLYLNQALKNVGYIDEDNYSFYHADGDLSLKIWELGYEIIDSPKSFIEHIVDDRENVRIDNLKKQPKDWEFYTNRWKGKLGTPKEDWIELSFNDPELSANKFNYAIKIYNRSKKILAVKKFLGIQ